MVQFSVKHEQGIDCGGGYVKLFPASLNQEDMHSESQYYIMFGKLPGSTCSQPLGVCIRTTVVVEKTYIDLEQTACSSVTPYSSCSGTL